MGALRAIVCDVAGVRHDAVTVDALARLQLAARRGGCEFRLQGAAPELVEVIEFMGLRDVLPLAAMTRTAAEARRAGTAARYRGRT